MGVYAPVMGIEIESPDPKQSIATKDALTAQAGTVDVTCRLPTKWPPGKRTTLFHVGDKTHTHVTLFFHGTGQLWAVYKANERTYRSIVTAESIRWTPGSSRRIVFSWGRLGEDFQFWLRCNGQLVGLQAAVPIGAWPDTCHIGEARGKHPWLGTIDRVRLAPTAADIPELSPGTRTIEVEAGEAVGTCHNFWSVSNFTSEDMFATPQGAAVQKRQKPFMKYVNTVRLLGGRSDGKNQWLKGIKPDGTVEADFSGLITYFRGMLDADCTPRVVLDNVPTAMSESGEMHTYGNTRPPKDERVWHQFIDQLCRELVAAFGMDVVKTWRFRVGTEPDLYPGHWCGTKEEYLIHYDFTVDAVTRVIPDAEIGPGNILNPARIGANQVSDRDQWGLDIVDHAAKGTNYCTGKVGTRLCYLQCSWYGQVGRPVDSFEIAVEKMQERLARYPQFAELPVDVAEFAILRDENNKRLWCGDITEWGASWYAAIAERVYELGVDQVHEWAHTSSFIKHPRALVIDMLGKMAGGERLKVAVSATSEARCGTIACRKEGALYVLVFNHRPLRRPNVPETVKLVIRDARMTAGASWELDEWLVDADHGVFAYELYGDCAEAGLEPLPDAALYGGHLAKRFGDGVKEVMVAHHRKYAGLAQLAQTKTSEPLTVTDGEANLEFDMPGHSVRLIRFMPP